MPCSDFMEQEDTAVVHSGFPQLHMLHRRFTRNERQQQFKRDISELAVALYTFYFQ